MVTQNWQDIVAKKRAECASHLPAEWRLPSSTLEKISAQSPISVVDVPATCGLLSAKELEITEKYDAVALVGKMASKELSSSEVTLAFCKRAAIAQQVANCLTEMFFDKALERAKELDEYLEKEGKPIGPLHGLPISLKDSFNLKDIFTTIGYVSFIRPEPADVNAPLAEILLKAGAVLYVKTNIPQTLMTADSDNNVFGRTLNPNKLTLTAGGSSGGEGALVRMRGSILGVGTDIAGSIRIPALCCGTYGFKPSYNRVPYGGQAAPVRDGTPADITPVAGPLAHTARDLRLFLETVLQAKPWEYDWSALAIPWTPVPKKKSLTVGVIIEDPGWPVAPPIVRAIKSAIDKLKAAGHRVILLEKFPSFPEATTLSWSYFDLDNEGTGFKLIDESGEPWTPSVTGMYAPPPEGRKPRSLDDLFTMNVKRAEFKAGWHQIFGENQLDVIVAPGNHATAVPHDTYGDPPYTVMWNLLNYPSCIIPYLTADKSIDVADPRIPSYDPEVVDGVPCHIQVIAKSEHDEALISAVEVIEEALKS